MRPGYGGQSPKIGKNTTKFVQKYRGFGKKLSKKNVKLVRIEICFMLFSSVMTKFTAKNRPFKTFQKFCVITRFILEKILKLANVETNFEE